MGFNLETMNPIQLAGLSILITCKLYRETQASFTYLYSEYGFTDISPSIIEFIDENYYTEDYKELLEIVNKLLERY